jgi:hypothetical protein
MASTRIHGVILGMNKSIFPKASRTECMLCAALLIALSGCVAYVDRPRAGEVYVAPPRVLVQDDYVYYPQYGMYYGSRSHQYYYQHGSSWQARPEPAGISATVLLASPSVRVDFHDNPAAHHAEVVRAYPRDWRPAGRDEGRREGPR